ncbi:MAG: 3-phosphoshikimate 1-carboxyvinyltransferase [Xanthomonadales bacterium]
MILRVAPPAPPVRGELRPPGDKSISHRALIFACLADGESRIGGLLEGEDVLATLAACRQLGLEARKAGETWILRGVGRDGLRAPAAPLDMGNSGTAMRLLAGVLAAQPFDSVLVGDESLSRRPMNRIVRPLTQMGARIETGPDGTPPLRIHGNPALEGIDYASPVASAQVKSCLLLAGLYARGRTSVREPHLSRDHTERMLPAFGVDLAGDRAVNGGSRLRGTELEVPGDISSAAFFLAAAALVPGSDLQLRNVGLNATRDGVIRVLQAMGADITLTGLRESGGERVGDIRVRYAGRLRATEITPEQVPGLIDELPVIFALAAAGEGTFRLRGAAELRVKESDRLAVMARGLETLGVSVEEYPDGIDITGGEIRGGAVDGAGDHRCAMSFCVLGQIATGPVTVDGAHNIATSYPDFARDLARLGGRVSRME